MSALTYRDLSTIASYGFTRSELGFSYLATDKAGNTWQAVETEDNDYLMFRIVLSQGQVGTGSFRTMTRKELGVMFNKQKKMEAA